jgi:hypothetical protein
MLCVHCSSMESNGQVERANAEIPMALKTHTYDGLKKHGKMSIDEVPCALWGNWTSPSRAIRETPFFLVYEVEAILPRKSLWAPSVSRFTMKPCRTSSDAKMSTLSTKEDDNLLLKMHGITRRSDAISSGSCTAESSMWVI